MTEPTYYLRTDDDGRPVRLLRGLGGPVEVWRDGRWQPVELFQSLDGLGSSADYRRVSEAEAREWLNGVL